MPDDSVVQVRLAEPAEAVGESLSASRLGRRKHSRFTFRGNEAVAVKRDGGLGEIGGGGYDAVGGACSRRSGRLVHIERFEDAIGEQFSERFSASLLYD